MRLDREAVEYVTWPATVDAPVAGPVTVWLAGAWQPATWDGSTVKVLCAGPDVASPPAGAVVLPLGRNTARVQFADTPEVVVRDGGTITVD